MQRSNFFRWHLLGLVFPLLCWTARADGQLAGIRTQTESHQAKGRKEKPNPSEIEKLINQLGSRNFSAREAASKALEGFGLDALEALRKTASSATDAEVRKRAGDLARAIEIRHEAEIEFAWFDRLGFPDLAKCQFVQVVVGQYHHRAFLVRDNGRQFTVLDASLWTHNYKKSGSQEPEQEKVTYEAWDLEKETTKILQSLEQPEDKDAWPRRFGERLTEPAELFVWARFCAANGKPKVADRLFALAKRSAGKRNEEAKINRSFHQIVADEIAHGQMWQAVQAFGEPTVSRKELLTRFDRIAKHFPQSPHAKRAQETAELLRKMVAEDEADARKSVKTAKEMTKDERIAELIFRLRDQNGQQWSQPGFCDVFAQDYLGPERSEKSPAQQLVDIGYEAVPQLIAALDDERFTRSVGFHRDFYFSHFVLRVCDCAEAVLERIAGRRFWEPRSTSAAMLKDGQTKEVKQRVQDWWEEFKKKGEKQVLIDGVRSGDNNSPEQAERLVKKYPESALSAIRQGVWNANRDWIAKSLLNSAAKLKGDATTEFLREELHGSALLTRVAAARGLLDWSREEAVGAMIEEWKKAGKGEGEEDLINFLLWCGKAAAVNALAKELHKRPVDTCLQVIDAINSPGWGWEKRQKSLAPEVEQAIDEILVGELDDPREKTGMSGSWGDKRFSNPRLCDLSGQLLAQRWKQPSWFDLSGSNRIRDRQRVELKNVWLKKQGKPPLPLPPL